MDKIPRFLLQLPFLFCFFVVVDIMIKTLFLRPSHCCVFTPGLLKMEVTGLYVGRQCTSGSFLVKAPYLTSQSEHFKISVVPMLNSTPPVPPLCAFSLVLTLCIRQKKVPRSRISILGSTVFSGGQ